MTTSSDQAPPVSHPPHPRARLPLAHELFDVTGGDEDRGLPREQLLAGVPGAQALLCLLSESIDGAVMDAAGGDLRVISNMAVGFDNIDVKAATERGILVTNTPGVLTDATADLTWSLILSIARRVVEGDAMVRNEGPWRWAPFLLLGRRVAGATLGIVGMGRIGQAVARRALGWDMKVVYTRSRGPLAAGQVPAGAAGSTRSRSTTFCANATISACTCRSLPTPATLSAPVTGDIPGAKLAAFTTLPEVNFGPLADWPACGVRV